MRRYKLKLDWNRKYTTIAVYTVVTALILMLLCVMMVNFDGVAAFFSKFNSIMMPFYVGLAIAYIANPLVKVAEKHIFRFKVTSKRRFNTKRFLSIAFAFIVLFVAVTIIFLIIIPQVILSISDLESKMSEYISKTVAWLDDFLPDSIFNPAELTIENFFNTILGYFTNSEFGEELSTLTSQLDLISDNLDTLIENSFTILKDYVPVVFSAFAGVANGVLNLVLGIFFAIYTLTTKETLLAQVKKIIRSFTNDTHYNSIIEFGNFTNKTFGSYLIGKVLDSIIVGIVVFIALAIFRIPYAPLLSVLIAITNIIPVIGPFIGAIPGVIIIFMVDPSKVIVFIILNIIIQQIDGNIIVPKILGETTGLSSLWVLFSITVMGGLWGLFGMFVSVPIFAILYMLFKLFVEKRLRAKELPADTGDYYDTEHAHLFDDDDEPKHSFAEAVKFAADKITNNSLIEKIKKKASAAKAKKQSEAKKDKNNKPDKEQ